MKNLAIATASPPACASLSSGWQPPAAAAPTGSNADATISQLEAQGHRVVINRLSDAPLIEANVVGVNKGGDIRSTVRDFRNDRTFQNSTTGSVYYVDVR